MSNPQAVVFDLDDTLYAEVDFVMSGFRSVADWAAHRWDLSTKVILAELDELQARMPGKVFNVWLEQRNFEPELATEMLAVYRAHSPTIEAFPEVRATISELKNSFQIGLISDGFLETQQNKFKALDLEDLFDAVIFSDQFGRDHWKPHPLPYETLLRKIKVDAKDAIYIGDNPKKDFVGAAGVGMRSIRFRHPKGVYAHLEPETDIQSPTLEARDWDSLSTAIADLFSANDST